MNGGALFPRNPVGGGRGPLFSESSLADEKPDLEVSGLANPVSRCFLSKVPRECWGRTVTSGQQIPGEGE